MSRSYYRDGFSRRRWREDMNERARARQKEHARQDTDVAAAQAELDVVWLCRDSLAMTWLDYTQDATALEDARRVHHRHPRRKKSSRWKEAWRLQYFAEHRAANTITADGRYPVSPPMSLRIGIMSRVHTADWSGFTVVGIGLAAR